MSNPTTETKHANGGPASVKARKPRTAKVPTARSVGIKICDLLDALPEADREKALAIAKSLAG